MGSYNFKAQSLPQGTKVKIVHNPLTREDIPGNMLKLGQVGTVVSSKNMLQSRPGPPPISVTKVLFQDNSSNVYLTTNLSRI